MSIVAERKRLLADRELRGSEFTLQLSDATDQWLQGLFSPIGDNRSDLALVAVGCQNYDDQFDSLTLMSYFFITMLQILNR